MREISYVQAINETLFQLMDKYDNAFLIGQGVNSPWYVGNTTRGLFERFGPDRVIDTPVSENGITGAAVGAALAGMRPVLVFPRMDFMYYAMDQIANHAATWHYMFGGQLNVPIVIWAIINRGGEQAAQHSQALQSLFVHIPGIKVVMPGTPYDAKGLLAASVEDDNPVVYIDDRWLYEIKGEVPEELYTVPIGEAAIRRKGKDITLTVNSYLVHEAVKAAEILSGEGIDTEVIDLRSIKPLDESTILSSVEKTGRLITVDGDWRTGGTGAEIAAVVAEKAQPYLKSPVIRVALPDTPAPASRVLEKAYYPDSSSITAAARKLLGKAG